MKQRRIMFIINITIINLKILTYFQPYYQLFYRDSQTPLNIYYNFQLWN